MFARRVEVVRIIVLAAIVGSSACSAYDPTLATQRLEADGGGSDSPDATVDGGDAATDAGDAAADAGPDGAMHVQDCRPNLDPDPEAVAVCPEICSEACNGLDDDCDGKADESNDVDVSCTAPHSVSVCQSAQCFVTQCLAGYRDCDQSASNGCEVAPDDVTNCGRCGQACRIADAQPACVQGQCVVGKCAAGYADCDLDGLTCELRTNTLTNCAGCGVACIDVPNAVPSCDTGVCGVATCKPGFGDCDGKPENGCEQSLDTLAHCAACNTACAKASCGGGVCTAADCTSMPGRADCDRDEASCEIDLRSDANNCGACGYQCKFAGSVTPHAALGCGASGCFANCDAGYGDCDGNYANGCELLLNTLTNCGICRAACTIAHATATCSTGSCQVQTCATDWGDCDGDKTSCETQLNAPNRCGSCATACNYPNAVEGCGGTAGSRVCTVAGCDANYADCDTTAANGCERDIRTPGAGGLGPCLPDTSCVKSTSGTHEYYVCPTARQWTDARNRCQLQAGGDLVQLTDAAEDTFVRGKIGASVWAGHNDSAHDGTWVWSRSNVPFWRSGTGAIASRYGNWAPSEPNNSGNCGVLYTSGQFDDAVCTSAMPFVCEVMPDECPSNAAKTDPGQCGCSMVDTDTDSDGVANCNDTCPIDPGKIAPGVCTCGIPDTNTDGDSQLDCNDGCPNDPNKIAPGVCTCGIPDTNTDGDSQLDCQENCDMDPAKLDPGICGCGNPDTDTDIDGTVNCMDGCPLDNTTVGACFPATQSNFSVANLDFMTAPATTLNCGGTPTINSSSSTPFSNWCGTAPSFVIQPQSGGPDMMVIALKGLTVAANNTLKLIGARPVVFAVRGNVLVDGTIDANASGSTAGAGGNWSCGSSAGGNGSGDAGFGDGGGGGGGGAFGTAGGRGGEGDNETNYGSGGSARGNANMTPLFGGCGGGQGGGCSSSNGGAGGGAVQITASGTIDINGTIRANGGNGQNGCGTEGGGTGGGSGGAILLEAPTRDTVGATITANGGGGGDGTGFSNGNGASGSTSASSSGGTGQDESGAGGGGGGGYGRIKK